MPDDRKPIQTHRQPMTPGRLFRFFALSEGVTWALLLTDPRDAHWFDRLFRWFINHPLLLGVTLVVVVATIFATLLSLGSPSGWFGNEG